MVYPSFEEFWGCRCPGCKGVDEDRLRAGYEGAKRLLDLTYWPGYDHDKEDGRIWDEITALLEEFIGSKKKVRSVEVNINSDDSPEEVARKVEKALNKITKS